MGMFLGFTKRELPRVVAACELAVVSAPTLISFRVSPNAKATVQRGVCSLQGNIQLHLLRTPLCYLGCPVSHHVLHCLGKKNKRPKATTRVTCRSSDLMKSNPFGTYLPKILRAKSPGKLSKNRYLSGIIRKKRNDVALPGGRRQFFKEKFIPRYVKIQTIFSGCNLFLKIGPVENLDILSLLMFHVSKTGNQVWPTVLYVSLDRTVMQRTGGNCPAHDESYKACGGGNTWAGIMLCWWNTREAGCSFKAKISSSKYTFSLDGVENEISNAVISTAMQTEEAIKANA